MSDEWDRLLTRLDAEALRPWLVKLPEEDEDDDE